MKSPGPRPTRALRALWWLWGLFGLALGFAQFQLARSVSPAQLTAHAAELTGERHLAVLVSGQDRRAVSARVETLTERLRHVNDVQAVHGLRGPERLFFALRWPLYLDEAELRSVANAVREVPPTPAPHFAFDLLWPVLSKHFERANALYAASTEAAATPDGRAIAMLITLGDSALPMVRRVLAEAANELRDGVHVEVESEAAGALLFGSPFPVFVVTDNEADAQRLLEAVRTLQARDSQFPIREARSVATYLPATGTAQLGLMQALRAFLASSDVASFNQAQRDAVRPLVPAQLRASPRASELPAHIQALFRTGDGSVQRLVHLLPRAGLSPDVSHDVERMEKTLAALGVSSRASGRFVLAAAAERERGLWKALGGAWLCAGLGLCFVRFKAWRPTLRVRRVVAWALGVSAVCCGLSWAASRALKQALSERAPWLAFDGAYAAFPLGLRLEHPRITHARGTLDAGCALVTWSSPWALGLHVDGAVAHLNPSAEQSVPVDLALGHITLVSSLLGPWGVQRAAIAGGDIALELAGSTQRTGALDLHGSLSLLPALFGRLPLLGEAGRVLGDGVRSTAPRSVHLGGTFSAPEVSGL